MINKNIALFYLHLKNSSFYCLFPVQRFRDSCLYFFLQVDALFWLARKCVRENKTNPGKIERTREEHKFRRCCTFEIHRLYGSVMYVIVWFLLRLFYSHGFKFDLQWIWITSECSKFFKFINDTYQRQFFATYQRQFP